MSGGIPGSQSDKHIADANSLLGAAGRIFIFVGLAGPMLFSLWSAAGYVRDVGFNQFTLYPVRCRDAACADPVALPRIRFEVDAKRQEVVLWEEHGWDGALGNSDVYRLTGCIVVDRTTWTCQARHTGGVFAFHDGHPLRVDALPLGSAAGSPWRGLWPTFQFVSRLQWYKSVFNSWLTVRAISGV